MPKNTVQRSQKPHHPKTASEKGAGTARAHETNNRVLFTEEMRETHTILIPEMLPVHFEIVLNVLRESGYKMELLRNHSPSVPAVGQRYVHNDTCYPALLVIGQMIEALQSGKYDLDHTALMITQTGGGCRASNYIHLLRKALKKAGFEHIPVISLNVAGLEKNPGFKITLKMGRKLIAAFVYGDLLMLLSNQRRPYEKHPGETDKLLHEWTEKIAALFRQGKGYGMRHIKHYMPEIAASFAAIPCHNVEKIRVGVVGEIYVKYAPLGNNELEEFLKSQDCEYMIPGVLGFGMFITDNHLEDIVLYGGSFKKATAIRALIWYFRKIEDAMIKSIQKYPELRAPMYFYDMKALAQGVIGYGVKMGEGWLLTAEMLELAHHGYPNIICAQPFGCLPNHIAGRGMMNKVKERCPEANIVAIDYDPSAARVNQENRIKLMLACAKKPGGSAPVQETSMPAEGIEAVPSAGEEPLEWAEQT